MCGSLAKTKLLLSVLGSEQAEVMGFHCMGQDVLAAQLGVVPWSKRWGSKENALLSLQQILLYLKSEMLVKHAKMPH